MWPRVKKKISALKILYAQSMFNLQSVDGKTVRSFISVFFLTGEGGEIDKVAFSFSTFLSSAGSQRTSMLSARCARSTRSSLLQGKSLPEDKKKGGTEVARNGARDERKLISAAAAAAPQTALITQG